MAVIFIEGFDKYGPVATVSANVAAALTAGEWTTAPAGVFNIVAGLSSTGYAMQIAYAGTQAQLVKTFASTWTRWIGGIRFSSTLGTNAGIGFASNGTQASTITINTTGAISLRTGTSTGTALSTSSSTVSANSTHYLEWDITFGASSSYQVWLDGVSIFSGTGNTANGVSSVNQFNFFGSATCTIQWDDLYLFDSTTGTNNAVLNTNPRIGVEHRIVGAGGRVKQVEIVPLDRAGSGAEEIELVDAADTIGGVAGAAEDRHPVEPHLVGRRRAKGDIPLEVMGRVGADRARRGRQRRPGAGARAQADRAGGVDRDRRGLCAVAGKADAGIRAQGRAEADAADPPGPGRGKGFDQLGLSAGIGDLHCVTGRAEAGDDVKHASRSGRPLARGQRRGDVGADRGDRSVFVKALDEDHSHRGLSIGADDGAKDPGNRRVDG